MFFSSGAAVLEALEELCPELWAVAINDSSMDARMVIPKLCAFIAYSYEVLSSALSNCGLSCYFMNVSSAFDPCMNT
jgi:hypothetical protein